MQSFRHNAASWMAGSQVEIEGIFSNASFVLKVAAECSGIDSKICRARSISSCDVCLGSVYSGPTDNTALELIRSDDPEIL